MAPDDQILNRVSTSVLVTLDLEEFYVPGKRIVLDIKDQLFQGLVLREKDFRNYVKQTDWTVYRDAHVAICCSADAIVPTWAYMLLTIAIEPYAATTCYGTLEELETLLFRKMLDAVDWQKFTGAKVVVKGCSKVEVPVAVYVDATSRLRPLAASIMFGEPCSTVPLYKAKAGSVS
jgi:hypothetical protein